MALARYLWPFLGAGNACCNSDLLSLTKPGFKLYSYDTDRLSRSIILGPFPWSYLDDEILFSH